MTICTTLNRIRAHDPCARGWIELLAGLSKTKADDEPLPFSRIVEINGLNDALWACRVEPQHAKEWRLFAVWCARRVEHLLTDARSVAAINVAERHAHGMATDGELSYAAWNAWNAWCYINDGATDAPMEVAIANTAQAAAETAWAVVHTLTEDVETETTTQIKKFLEIVG